MRIITLLLLLHTFTHSLTAQTNTLIFRLLDAVGQPVEAATVGLLRGVDSSLVKTELSDATGQVTFEQISADATLLSIRCMGYQPRWLPVAEAGATLTLQNASTELREVTIASKKQMFELQADKIVVNVENSPLATGNSAFELLRKSPGIIIDQNDNLSLRGKNGVRIYIDGKPSPLGAADLAAMLQGMQASDIEAIEIIANPSAKYDAAGNAGIINVRLKKNKNFGANGTLSAGYVQGIYGKFNTNANLNYRNGKVNLFGSYGANGGPNWNFFDFYRQQNGLVFDQKTTNVNRGVRQNIKAGVDFFLHKNHTLGVAVNGFDNENFGTSITRTPIYAEENPDKILELLLADGSTEGRRRNLNTNLNYAWTGAKNRSFSADLDYGTFDLYTEQLTPNRYVSPTEETRTVSELNFFSQTPTLIQLFSAKADYEQPLAQGKLSVGVKSAEVRTDNTFDFYNIENQQNTLDLTRSNQFVYTEWVHAAYGQWNRDWKKWNFSAGLRAEHTRSEGDLRTANEIAEKNVRRRYTDFFPSAGASYQLNQTNRFSFNYSRRIDRPVYADLNPFEYRINELTYSKGNPFLQPQYTHNLELSHSYQWKLNTSLSYSYVNGYFANVSDTIEGRRSFLRKENFDRQDVWSLSVSYPFQLTKWWSGFANATGAATRYRAEFEPGKFFRINNQALSTYMQNSFALGKGLSFELSGSYNTPNVWGGTYRNRVFWFVDAGFQQKYERLTLRLIVADLFLSMRWRGVAEFGGLYAVASGGWESRQLRLNATYNFGKTTVKKARQRKSGLDDLNRRVE